MTGAEIIAGAQADGLVLSVEDGLLSIAGSAATIDLWRFELVTQKAEIVDLLQAASAEGLKPDSVVRGFQSENQNQIQNRMEIKK